ncbi:MAG: hypothetical protein DRR16_20685 [Candidatus Parabeggiatoa sp. nov. 3]|nr:MAG: hypothetical protein DRR00_07525 [Gammaproteobacteria bacterium]RKZ67140.1 MAG: hypothetical protein DRQ99_07575 [Gammaproteobacteria bacterium]RKZ82036.1 MAG: hypothetical protein DRR16_20685 [Gammaproteobacteria bacterium]
MSRDALVVGINLYTDLNELKKPANDAEAIAQLLETQGDFRVKRLPCIEQAGQLCIDNTGAVSFEALQQAIVQLFNPETDKTDHLPETALLFFAGHGLRKVDGGIAEGYLATSDAKPNRYHWGLSLHWLQRLLQKSQIKQQIVCLDCCFSGEFNFEEADPGERGSGYGRCFIAASRDYEEAYESASSRHGVLTEVLLRGLAVDGTVDNYALTDFIQQNLKQSVQKPVTHNSGSRIVLTHQPVEMTRAKLSGVCPYKGLRFFEEADAQYFYGRDNLTDVLIEKVRVGHFLAVLGVSGSGKSSVVRAGLLHQLKLGQKLGESRQWRICKPFTPTEKDQTPLENLARVLVPEDLPDATWLKELDNVSYLLQKGAVGFKQWLDKIEAPRVVLVVDQFEELFTRCELTERQPFLECVLGCLPPPEAPVSKLCVVITMRADFLGKCAEQAYAGLTGYIDAHQVTVRPMSETELKAAISEPAKKVGLDIEAELITAMLKEVEGPASLPLLEYTLTELWQHHQLNCLTLAEYMRLGGVQGTLQKSADTAYEALTAAEQSVAQWIFLALTQLGEGTEDTRRQVLKKDLVTTQHSATLIDKVLDKLATARLVVVDALGSRGDKQSLVTVIDVAHETLIRHWGKLRRWLSESRSALSIQREIEAAAQDWEVHEKYKDYFLQGPKLGMAEDYVNHYADKVPLSNLAQEFVQASQIERDRSIKEEENTQRKLKSAQKLLATNKELENANKKLRRQSIALKLSLIILIGAGILGWWQWGMAEQRGEITELRYKGLLLERAEQHQPALNYYQKALKISQKINDYKAQASNLSDCGTMCLILKKPEQALDYFKQALNIREQLGDSEDVKFENNNIVLAYGKLGEVEKALELYEQITGLEGKGRRQFVGFIERLNCSSDAFELLSGDTVVKSLFPGRPLYHADQLKVTKENCRINLIINGQMQTINKDNSPYIVDEKGYPSSGNSISEWFGNLWIAQEYGRIIFAVTR